ncbi:MAG: MFS transporter [Fimbriimonadales bacterium]|nr:MFS transporter [Fimbriimonadales bacterium]
MAERATAVTYEGEAAVWSDRLRDRWFRWNSLALALDGGFFGAAMSVVAADSVQTTLVRSLGGPDWLVSLTPSLMMIGFVWSPILTVRWVERLRAYKRPVALVSLGQRLPALFAALALYLWAHSAPSIALWFVALAPLVSGFIGGLTLGAFWQLVAKVLPERRRSSSLALRNLIATILGFVSGLVVKAVLARWPGFEGYALLYLLQFCLLMASFAAFAAIRELPNPAALHEEPSVQGNGWTRLLRLWRSSALVRGFVRARLLGLGLLVATPFLAIHARESTGASLDVVGGFVSAQMLGAVLGNLIGGPFGDRKGGRALSILACALLCSAAVVAGLAVSVPAFLTAFAMIGAGNTLLMNGSNTLQLELFPPKERPAVFALVSAVALPGYLGAAGAATLVRELQLGFPVAAWMAAMLLALALLRYWLLPQPLRPG